MFHFHQLTDCQVKKMMMYISRMFNKSNSLTKCAHLDTILKTDWWVKLIVSLVCEDGKLCGSQQCKNFQAIFSKQSSTVTRMLLQTSIVFSSHLTNHKCGTWVVLSLMKLSKERFTDLAVMAVVHYSERFEVEEKGIVIAHPRWLFRATLFD